MTRNEIDNEIAYCNQVEGAIINGYCCETVDNLLDRIINEHETAIEILMKANEEEISRHFNELKAKDKITQDIKEAYKLKSIAYDLLLEAIKLKDEEIERLKAELAIATKRFDAKNRGGKALKKILSMAWSKQLKE